jgi:hypothetical protein
VGTEHGLAKRGGGTICRSVGKMRTRRVHVFQLLLVCLLTSTTFAFGFLVAVRPLGNANPSPPAPRHSSLPPHPQAASPSVAPPALADPGEAPVAVGVDFESLDEREPADKGVLKTATFTKILPFPFEQVRDYWENGPPDPNFIREEIVLQVNGAEEHRSKTIYTNNPLPWILKKTVRLPCLQCSASVSFCTCAVSTSSVFGWRCVQLIRADFFVFREEQHVNLRDKYSHASCWNQCLQGIGILTREARMSAIADKPGWTKFEQTITTNFTTAYGYGVKDTMERFAIGLFINTAKRGTDTLERTLRGLSVRAVAVDGGALGPTSVPLSGAPDKSHGSTLTSAEGALQVREPKGLWLYAGGVYAWCISSVLLVKEWTLNVLVSAAHSLSLLVSSAASVCVLAPVVSAHMHETESVDAHNQAGGGGRGWRMVGDVKAHGLASKLAQPLILGVLGSVCLSLQHRAPMSPQHHPGPAASKSEMTMRRRHGDGVAPLHGAAELGREAASELEGETRQQINRLQPSPGNTLHLNTRVDSPKALRQPVGVGAFGALVWPKNAAERFREMAASAAAAAFVG